MRSAFIRFLLFLLAVPVGSLAETERSPINTPNFSTVVASPEIKEPLTNDQLNACIRETARVMKVEGQQRPQIVILQLAPAEARRLGLTQTILLSNKGRTEPGMFYEVWLVGEYALGDLARGVEMVYELHFGFDYTDIERGRVVKQIARFLEGTVNVNALRDKSAKAESR